MNGLCYSFRYILFFSGIDRLNLRRLQQMYTLGGPLSRTTLHDRHIIYECTSQRISSHTLPRNPNRLYSTPIIKLHPINTDISMISIVITQRSTMIHNVPFICTGDVYYAITTRSLRNVRVWREDVCRCFGEGAEW